MKRLIRLLNEHLLLLFFLFLGTVNANHFTDKNHPLSTSSPTDILISNNNIDENKATGIEVGKLTAVDQDSDDTFNFFFVDDAGGEGNKYFKITENKLYAGVSFDAEKQQLYNLLIGVEDSQGNIFIKTIEIFINDVNEFSPTSITISKNNIIENNQVGAIIAQFTTKDNDVSAPHQYFLILEMDPMIMNILPLKEIY